MNPSVQDILAAVNSSGYQELIVLPNNSNIVLTARHVAGADAAPTCAWSPPKLRRRASAPC